MRPRILARRSAVPFLAVVFALTAANVAPTECSCELSAEDQQLLQESLDNWERLSRDFLSLDPSPLPWVVVFDGSCVWHLEPDESLVEGAEPVALSLAFGGAPVRAWVLPHDGTIVLPNEGRIPARPMAFASLYNDGEAPFFVVALRELWQESARASSVDVDELVLGIVAHEMVHTRQLVDVNRRVDELGEHYDLPENVSDDIVEERFREDPGYVAAYEAESDLFYEAAAETDPRARRDLVADALELVRARQDRYFTGEDEVYRELDGLFLNMEGVAVWAAYKLLQVDPENTGLERARNSWTQDEGLALFLLIDAMVPSWRARVLGPELASPFTLLDEALRAR